MRSNKDVAKDGENKENRQQHIDDEFDPLLLAARIHQRREAERKDDANGLDRGPDGAERSERAADRLDEAVDDIDDDGDADRDARKQIDDVAGADDDAALAGGIGLLLVGIV